MQPLLFTFVFLLTVLFLFPTLLLRKLSRQRLKSYTRKHRVRQSSNYRLSNVPDDRC
jgi:hypothetical protein